MYITYSDYVRYYGSDRIEEGQFERIALNVDRVLDMFTTGIDNYRKLREAFPTDEADAQMVKVCGCRIADIIFQVEKTEAAALQSKDMTQTENGVHGKAIASMSAGNESVSYVTGTGTTLIDQAASSIESQHQIIADVVKTFLSGIEDANGVNLLYMGRYPHV